MSLIFSALFAPNALAQEMRPLNQVIRVTAKSYPYIRCAGFYQAMMEWAGKEKMGGQLFSKIDKVRTNLILTAVATNMSDGLGGGVENSISVTTRDVRNVAKLYISRFERNFAAVGQAWGEDKLVLSDVSSCKKIAERNPTK